MNGQRMVGTKPRGQKRNKDRQCRQPQASPWSQRQELPKFLQSEDAEGPHMKPYFYTAITPPPGLHPPPGLELDCDLASTAASTDESDCSTDSARNQCTTPETPLPVWLSPQSPATSVRAALRAKGAEALRGVGTSRLADLRSCGDSLLLQVGTLPPNSPSDAEETESTHMPQSSVEQAQCFQDAGRRLQDPLPPLPWSLLGMTPPKPGRAGSTQTLSL